MHSNRSELEILTRTTSKSNTLIQSLNSQTHTHLTALPLFTFLDLCSFSRLQTEGTSLERRANPKLEKEQKLSCLTSDVIPVLFPLLSFLTEQISEFKEAFSLFDKGEHLFPSYLVEEQPLVLSSPHFSFFSISIFMANKIHNPFDFLSIRSLTRLHLSS